MNFFLYRLQLLSAGVLRPGVSVPGNPEGIRKTIISPILFFFLTGSFVCGQGGVVHQRSLIHDGMLRQYLLYVPNDYTGQEEWPLVINYHGWTSNATAQMNTYSKMNLIADTAHFLVAYPQGFQILVPGFGPGAGWNLPGYIANQDDISFSDSLLDHIDADFSIDLSRVHATGWSNGCTFSFYLAHRLPHRFASAGGVAGPLTYELLDSLNAAPGRPFSALLMHGTADGLVPYTGVPGLITPATATASYWSSRNNCSPDSIVTDLPEFVVNDNSTVTLIAYVGGDDDTEVLLYRINKGGHGWPGTGPYSFGPTNLDINASAEIWNFFKRNPMPASAMTGVADRAEHLPATFRLHPNYPNPFSQTTTITYSVLEPSHVELKIYNEQGQLVKKLVDGYHTTGEYSAVWDGKDNEGSLLAPGIYFYRIKMGAYGTARKMAYLK
ncbi:MAG TPA: T9SS type A sorting domain-containing protein [Bacteroides sp.]|nr:T9SS type A sorting domain-containing protein [Bacteroides sp.]